MSADPGNDATRRRVLSIRARLIIGAGMLAALAIVAALVMAYEARETSREVARIEEAQARIERFAGISGLISDYAVTALNTTAASFSTKDSIDRLAEKAVAVEGALTAIMEDLLKAGEQGQAPDAQTRRQLERITRMKGIFAIMHKSMIRALEGGRVEDLSASINVFSSQFTPLLGAVIGEEQARRQAAIARMGEIRKALVLLAVAVVMLTLFLLFLFNLRIIGPIVSRIGRIGEATKSIAAGDFRIDLPTDPADELGALFHQTNRMAEELDRGRRKVEQDRNRLEGIVESRTRELREANERLARTDEHRKRFFTDVSHELRTPLTVILAEAELSRGAPREDVEASLEIILTRARRLNRRIDDLLRVARSESGRIELFRQPADLSEIASQAGEEMRPVLKTRRMTLKTDLDEAGPVFVDRDWIRQIVSGVIGNAVKHAPEGSKITIRTFRSGSEAVIEIRDQGPGIDAQMAGSAFERFRKGPGAFNGSGFGIGLALAKWVMEEHEGSIGLENAAEGGLVVRLGLTLVSDGAMLERMDMEGARDNE